MSRYLVACDAGGTMTDVIVVDEEGRSVIGKANGTAFFAAKAFCSRTTQTETTGARA